jgi:uncharacterized membrane protein
VLAQKIKAMFTPHDYGSGALREAISQWDTTSGYVLICFLALTGLVLVLEWLSIARRAVPFYFLQRPAILMILVILTVLFSPQRNNGFIYFAF